MLTENINKISEIIFSLINYLKTNKDELFLLNYQITNDNSLSIEEDYNSIIDYLNNYINNNKRIIKEDNLKPKGKILIMLSYNEPFILSIIPVLNAIIAGNYVIIKPSQLGKEFVKNIWLCSGIIKKYNLKISFSEFSDIKLARNLIKQVSAVYFFGSYKVAKKIAKVCREYFIEFYPEVETADCKIYNTKLSNIINIEKDVELTIKESFSHQGQICQRIQGIYVNKNNYNEYLRLLKKKFLFLCGSEELNKYINKNHRFNHKLLKYLKDDVRASSPKEIISAKGALPILVVNPEIDSSFINNAYFLPVLWISPFKTERQLIKLLNLRKFFLGINIHSDNNNFINNIIKNTKFTRYTINSSHIKVRDFEGWGGSWPSGYSGNKNWIRHFSNPYVIIR